METGRGEQATERPKAGPGEGGHVPREPLRVRPVREPSPGAAGRTRAPATSPCLGMAPAFQGGLG